MHDKITRTVFLTLTAGIVLVGCSDGHRSRLVGPIPTLSWVNAGDWAYDITPDATQLLYRHRLSADALNGVYLMDLQSPSLAHELVFADSMPYSFTNDCRFSPDATKIAYTWNFRFDIYVRDLEDGSDRRITFTSGNARSSDWDPSGRFLVYMRVSRPYDAPDSVAGIHIVDTQTLTDRALRVGGKVVFGDDPRWSPDGKYIAYSLITRMGSGETMHSHIWVASVDGSSAIDVTASSGWDSEAPEWLGTGEVVFESREPSNPRRHATQAVRPDGSGLRTLPVDLQPGVGYSAVAGTAGQFVYTDGDTGSNFGVLFIRRLDDRAGATIRQLTTFKPLPESLSNPSGRSPVSGLARRSD